MPPTNSVTEKFKSCLCQITQQTLLYAFITGNSLVVVLSVLVVIYNLVLTIGNFAANDAYQHLVPEIPGLTDSAVKVIIMSSTLLVSVFSGVAAMGIEAAAFRRHWRNPIFTPCGMHVLQIKMAIYIVIVGVLGLGLSMGTVLLQTNVLPLKLEKLITEGYTVSDCGELTDFLLAIQETHKCCGIKYTKKEPNTESEVTQSLKLAANLEVTVSRPTCGNWFDNKPKQCECDPLTDDSCMNASEAETFGCQITSKGIWRNDCLDIIQEEYFGGFGLIWIISYVLAFILLSFTVLAIVIYTQEQKVEDIDNGTFPPVHKTRLPPVQKERNQENRSIDGSDAE